MKMTTCSANFGKTPQFFKGPKHAKQLEIDIKSIYLSRKIN